MPRDSAGNYTLPAGNPVASGEIISANWANTTMEDLGDALSASLDRYGRGGMLAPFAFADGTESAPGATWSNEPTTGLYRNAYADLRMTVTGQDNQRWTATSSFLWRNSQWEEIITAGGSVAIDSLTITNDLSVGGDTTLTGGLTVDGTTLVVDDVNNRVGIGTANPLTNAVISNGGAGGFEFTPDAAYGGGILEYINRTSTSTNPSMKLSVPAGGGGDIILNTGGSDRLTVTSSGNVGIGTASPTSLLDLSDVTPELTLTDTGTSTRAEILYGGGNLVFDSDAGNTGGASTTIFKVDNAERMRIDSVGRVGIGGAPTSSRKLQIIDSGDVRVDIRSGTDTNLGAVDFSDASNTGRGQLIYDHSSDSMEFKTLSAERMRIDSSGNVGIGIASPATELHIFGTNPALRLQSSGVSTSTNISFLSRASDNTATYANIIADSGSGGNAPIVFTQGAGGTERMRIDTNGNLLVGTTSAVTGAANGEQVSGSDIRTSRNTTSAVQHVKFYNSNGQVGNINTSGSATAYATSSDARLKENIVDAPAGNIDALQVRSFDWKVNGEHQTYGFIAQELEQVAPEAVYKGETEDDMWGVDYSKLVPMLVKEIQDLKAEVEALKG